MTNISISCANSYLNMKYRTTKKNSIYHNCVTYFFYNETTYIAILSLNRDPQMILLFLMKHNSFTDLELDFFMCALSTHIAICHLVLDSHVGREGSKCFEVGFTIVTCVYGAIFRVNFNSIVSKMHMILVAGNVGEVL